MQHVFSLEVRIESVLAQNAMSTCSTAQHVTDNQCLQPKVLEAGSIMEVHTCDTQPCSGGHQVFTMLRRYSVLNMCITGRPGHVGTVFGLERQGATDIVKVLDDYL